MNAFYTVVDMVKTGKEVNIGSLKGAGRELLPRAVQDWVIRDAAVFQFPGNDTGYALVNKVLWDAVCVAARRGDFRGASSWYTEDTRVLALHPGSKVMGVIIDVVRDYLTLEAHDFIWKHTPKSLHGRRYVPFGIPYTLAGQALVRDVLALLPDGGAVHVVNGGADELHIRWFKDDDSPAQSAEMFTDIMDRFLIDGVYNPETLLDIQDEHEMAFEGVLVDTILRNAIAPESFREQFGYGDQFFYDKLQMETEWHYEEMSAACEMPGGGRVAVDNEADGVVITAWVEWFDELYNRHLNGQVALAAADQPRLPLEG